MVYLAWNVINSRTIIFWVNQINQPIKLVCSQGGVHGTVIKHILQFSRWGAPSHLRWEVIEGVDGDPGTPSGHLGQWWHVGGAIFFRQAWQTGGSFVFLQRPVINAGSAASAKRDGWRWWWEKMERKRRRRKKEEEQELEV